MTIKSSTLTDWDFREGETMREAIDVVKYRKACAIVLSTAMGITKFRSRCSREDPHRLMRQSASRVNKAVKCAREQDNRGLYFALETIISKEGEEGKAMQELVNQQGILESNEYSIMYREGQF